MLDRLRLLPTVMLVAAMLLGLKVIHLVGGLDDVLSVGTAQASSAEAPAAEGGEAEHAGKASEGGAHGEGAASSEDAANKAALAAQTQQLNETRLSPAEIAVLGSLTARREEIDKRAKDLDLREQMLSAAEKRVEDRITELKAIEAKINGQIAANDKQNEERLAGVVKMYETMKPKDAARIFERLDMGVLIDVAKRMEPRKMSAVLAVMDPVAAQELTVELATGDKLPEMADAKAPAAAKAPPAEKGAATPPAAPQAAAPGANGSPG
jgi:flagellar motility protein MotE (MotC chaperone)